MINNSSNNMNIQAYEQKLFEHFFNNSHTKTALNPKGYLVHQNPIEQAGSAVTDLGKDVVKLTKALKDGDGDDCSLGRLNDLGMKLGAAGIATYLLTRKSTPKAKMMEFAGAGVFLSMMSLWRKVFIAAPIKARFGVDINQKYVDSMGRKKDLLLDNQYIPALETDEELDKLADKLKLPKDMEYRREYAKELRRKIGLQGRTLDMLTVGVATPVLTALICNGIEKYADSAIINHGIKSADKKAGNFDKVVQGKVSNPLFDRDTGASIIKQYSKGVSAVDDALFNNLADAFNPANAVVDGKIAAKMPDFAPQIKHDLEMMFADSIDEKMAASDIFDLFASHSKDEGDFLVVKTADGAAGTAEVRIAKDKLQSALNDTMQKVKEGKINYDGESILKALKMNESMLAEAGTKSVSQDALKTLQEQYIKSCLNNPDEIRTIPQILESIKQGNEIAFNNIAKDSEGLFDGITSSKKLAALPSEFLDDTSKVFKDFIQDGKKKFAPGFMQRVETSYKSARQISASLASLDEIVKPIDFALGKQYSNIVDAVFSIAKPDMKQLDLMRNNAEAASEYLLTSLKEIAKDSEKYDKLLKGLEKSPAIDETKRADIISKLVKNAKEALNKASVDLDPKLKTLFEMSNASEQHTKGFVADIEKYAAEAFPGIDSTTNRWVLAADLEKRLEDGTLKQQWDALQAKSAVSESFETFVNDARRILHKSTPGDFANTHYIHGNGVYYKRLNDMLFNQPLSSETTKAIKGTKGLAQRIDEMRGSLMAMGSRGFGHKKIAGDKLAVADYVNNANCLVKKAGEDFFTICDEISVNNDIIKKAFEETLIQPDSIKYQKVGKSLKSFAFENASQKFNSKVWMRIFAPIAGVLVGVTLLSQMFIGKKNKDQHLYMDKMEKTQSGAVNGNK